MQILKEDVRNKILAAALKEFKDNGYEKASMRKIAKSANLTAGNLYRYFKNKEDLFYHVIRPAYERFVWMATEFKKEDRVIDENFLEAYLKIEEIQIKHRDALLILLHKSKGSKYENIKTEFIELLKNRFKKIILLNTNTKTPIKYSDSFLSVISRSIIEGLVAIMEESTDEEDIKKVTKLYIELFIQNVIMGLLNNLNTT